jgi:hypothetical protein
MRTLITLFCLTLLFSCKEIKVDSSYEETLVIKQTKPKLSPLSFEEMLKKLAEDENVKVVDAYHPYPQRPYVVAYMQRHKVTEKRARLSDQSKEESIQVQSVIKEIASSFLQSIKPYDLPIYVEGLNQEAGLIDLSSSLGSQSFKSGKVFDSLRVSGNRIYGIETATSRGINVALKSIEEDRSEFLRKKNYDNLSSQEKAPIAVEYIRSLPNRLNRAIEINNGSDSYVSRDEGNAVLAMFRDGITKDLLAENSEEHHVRAYLNFVRSLKANVTEIKINYRNKLVVQKIPDHESSVLILGAAHFDNFKKSATVDLDHSKDVELIYIEDLLREKKLNYIILEPHSLY